MHKNKNSSPLKALLRLPGDLTGSNPRKRRNALLTLIILILSIATVALAVYSAAWYFERSRIIADSQRYRAMYTPATAAPTEVPTPEPTATPTVEPTPEPTATPTAAPTEAPTPLPTEETVVDVTLSPEEIPVTPEPMETLAPVETLEPVATETPEPLPTPGENTLVFALPTAPPVQDAFEELIALNPDTIGFLAIGEEIALPVVQRENDNDYYLDHNFDGDDAIEGALFLDGANRLVPEDDCLIVYGHNMKNGTMFGKLESYGDMSFLRDNAIVQFDTIYENRRYVPFAAFTASMNPGSRYYFDVRQFVFDEYSFGDFIKKMKTRSLVNIPVDVMWGDRVLMLVTCDYNNDSGRFILGLRQLRDGETEESMRAVVQKVQANP
ncbi:MAG: class B sortase [Clostridiales bacterium]|nr:class B sortase [Clostridiales bacterium]